MNRPKLEGLQPRRKRAGMTQADVADALWIERATVGMWETGASWPSARILPDLAGLLCCSIDELYAAPTDDSCHSERSITTSGGACDVPGFASEAEESPGPGDPSLSLRMTERGAGA